MRTLQTLATPTVLNVFTSAPLKISVAEFCVYAPRLALSKTFPAGPIKLGPVPEVLKKLL